MTNHHYANCCLLAVVLVLGLSSVGAAQTRQADPFVSKLPDGEGKQAVLEFCAGACHQSDRLLNAHKTPEEWHKTVQQMISNGAQLFPEDVDVVTKYLSTYLVAGTLAGAAK